MRFFYSVIVVAAIGILAIPTGLDSCAVAGPDPVFSTQQRPADAGAFLSGRLGVIRPTYKRLYLIAAYRTLSGTPLSAPASQSLQKLEKRANTADDADTARNAWTDARNKVPGPQVTGYLNTYRNKSGGGGEVYYPNCLSDAFKTARATLDARIRKWGPESAQVREWVTAQDQVFSNCGGTEAAIPAAPEPSMDPLLAADREYQIAAAYFYAGQWQPARERFEKIALNKQSPWKDIAPYLAARTFVREGTVDGKPDALREAERRLAAIGDARSRKLLEYVRLRLDPYAGVAQLGTTIAGAGRLKPGDSADIALQTADFLYLFDHREALMKDNAKLAATSDLADWLLAFEGPAENAASHSIDQWRKSHKASWLIASLLRATDPKDASEVAAAAHRVQPDAPEFESASYYGIAREIEAGHKDEARRWADEALSKKLLLSSRNLILTERLKLTRDWTEFLRFAPRNPEPALEAYDGSEQDTDKPLSPVTPLFDADSTVALDRQVPLALWLDASANKLLPDHLQLAVAQAGWVRAVLLGRTAEARAFMDRVLKLQPKSAAAARDYLSAASPEQARFAAAFLLLHLPNLQPWLNPGVPNTVELTEADRSGSGRWGFATVCAFGAGTEPPAEAPFLTPRQREDNDAEQKQLTAAAPVGATWLANETLQWARQHPDDPRIPESLHLVVQSGRRGCKDEQTATYSKQAFNLLHQRYEKSEWAAKTKYWYK
jgi:hypothetical protein